LKMKRKLLLTATPSVIDRFHKYSCYFSDLLSVLNAAPSNPHMDIFHNMSYANQASVIADWGRLCYGRILLPPQRASSP
jgi:hypothetical protein